MYWMCESQQFLTDSKWTVWIMCSSEHGGKWWIFCCFPTWSRNIYFIYKLFISVQVWRTDWNEQMVRLRTAQSPLTKTSLPSNNGLIQKTGFKHFYSNTTIHFIRHNVHWNEWQHKGEKGPIDSKALNLVGRHGWGGGHLPDAVSTGADAEAPWSLLSAYREHRPEQWAPAGPGPPSAAEAEQSQQQIPQHVKNGYFNQIQKLPIRAKRQVLALSIIPSANSLSINDWLC